MKTHQAILNEIPRLRRYARALAGDASRADDLVQDALERALSRLHQFTEGTNLRAWLMTILRNHYIGELRRESHRPWEGGGAEHAEPPDERNPAQESLMAVHDLMGALEHLPIEQREVVLLIGLEELSYKQASEVLAVPVGTVMSRLSRGRENLRRMMEGKPGARPSLRRVK